MDAQERIELIKQNTEEIVTEKELEELLEKKKKPVAYCGYELSGAVHLGHLVTLTKLSDLEKAGCKIKILLADVHSALNRKGSEEEIKKEEIRWRKTISALGMKAEIVLGSEFQFTKEYQIDVMKLAQHITLSRGLKSMQEIARDIENATVSQLWYPLMQAIDIKYLGVDLAVGGLEQRKVHMIGKDEAQTIGHRFIAIHTPLITSLRGPGQKMSKSVPGSGISLEDNEEEIKKALNNAYCPQKETKDNPVLQILKYIVFPRIKTFKIVRPVEFGGDISCKAYEELEKKYAETKIHPADLKKALASELNKIIAPLRKKIS